MAFVMSRNVVNCFIKLRTNSITNSEHKFSYTMTSMNENESELFKFIMTIIDMYSLRRLLRGWEESGDKNLAVVRLSLGDLSDCRGNKQLLHLIQNTVKYTGFIRTQGFSWCSIINISWKLFINSVDWIETMFWIVWHITMIY